MERGPGAASRRRWIEGGELVALSVKKLARRDRAFPRERRHTGRSELSENSLEVLTNLPSIIQAHVRHDAEESLPRQVGCPVSSREVADLNNPQQP